MLAFLSLWLIGFGMLFVYAIGQTLWYSFTNFNFMNKMKWIGLANYAYLVVSDGVFWQSLGNTGLIIAIVVPGILVLSFLFALLVRTRSALNGFASIAYFLPFVIPLAATGLVWRWMFNGEYGVINFVLGLLHIPGPDWLLNSALVKPAIAIAETTLIGQYFIIFVAALQDVPIEFYEAAELDGASGFRRMWSITLPMISPVIFFSAVIGVISSFQLFTQAYVASAAASGASVTDVASNLGYPAGSMMFYSVYLYQQGFQSFRMGYASAMAWMLFLITMVCTLLMIKGSNRWVHYQGGGFR